MAEANDSTAVARRRQYPWERKLEVLKYYYENGWSNKQRRNLELIRSAFTDGLLARGRSRKAAKERSELAADGHSFGLMLK